MNGHERPGQVLPGEEKHLKRRRQRQQKRHWWIRFMAVVVIALLVSCSVIVVVVVASFQREQHQPPMHAFKVAVDTLSSQLLRGSSTRSSRRIGRSPLGTKKDEATLQELLHDLNSAMHENRHCGIRWMDPDVLPSLHRNHPNPNLMMIRNKNDKKQQQRQQAKYSFHGPFFRIARLITHSKMNWEVEDQELSLTEKSQRRNSRPRVDYTQHQYIYPSLLLEPPSNKPGSSKNDIYPKLQTLQEIMLDWPQDELDHPPTVLFETLQHFDFQNPLELVAARKFRERQLPFKLYNIPELIEARQKWTDDYVARHFDGSGGSTAPGILGNRNEKEQEKQEQIPRSSGSCQESVTNFFAFFTPNLWNVETMALPPTRNNDWTFAKWAQHAHYSDTVGLDFDQPHFYWQSGVPKDERYLPHEQWTFISRDLPSFSSPNATFFAFEPKEQKGIQCRFGERGVTTATHFDSGRNMVAMISGAKRYILSPPRECSKLGIVTERGTAIFRHSLLNFGHLNYMDHKEMPDEERAWLERAGEADAVSTVLKAGESYTSHHIGFITLQVFKKVRSAMCGVA
jgi:hypothetical protein